MTAAEARVDDKVPVGRERDPMGVVVSQIILALGLCIALGVIAMAVVWSSSPSRHAKAPASWRASHHFRAVARARAPPRIAVSRAAKRLTAAGSPVH